MLAHPRILANMKIQLQSSTPPVVEFDQSVAAWYVRFGNGKVARTTHREKRGAIVNIDVDSQNRVIGIELLGIREFTIRAFFLGSLDLPRPRWTGPATGGPKFSRCG